MIRAKFYFIFSVIFLLATICNAQSNLKTTQKDFRKLSGSWQGSLTYLDYSTGKPYTMPADIEISHIAKTNKFAFSNIYPKEASANSIDTITISTDGKYIDKELVKSRRKLANGNIQIVSEELGKDDNKQATIRHIYIFGKTFFSNIKDVQFIGETEWIRRHEYSYTKK